MAKILVVDDDASIAELLRMRFTEAGHQVVIAQDGLAGPMLAARDKPDLIILDFNMPAANGGKVLERLRGSTYTAATPVIFVTASPVAEVMSQVPEDPRVRFLSKPVDFTALARLTRELLAGPALPETPTPSDDGPLDLD